jgi:hypothetical protein
MNRFCLSPAPTLILLLGACSAIEASPDSALGAPLPATSGWPRGEVERDLVLKLERTSRQPIQPGDDPELRVVLSNRSPDRAYPVVLSGDGSEPGWREPHAWFELAVRSAGEAFHPPPPVEHTRCGNFDRDWQRDVVLLAPGKSLALPWLSFYFERELLAASEVRLIAHYSYGERAKDLHAVPVALHMMPAYALQSAPLALPVAHPLALRLALHGPIPRGPGQPLSAAISVMASNVSQRPIPWLTAGGGSELSFELGYAGSDADGSQGPLELGVSEPPSSGEAEVQILPGMSRAVLDAGTRTDESWQLPPELHLSRIRAILSVSANHTYHVAASPWVTVPAGQ